MGDEGPLPDFKRLRYGPLGTGVFNALSLPGVKKRVREGETEPDIPPAKERKHLYFDGNANQLHYPDDTFYADKSGFMWARQRDELSHRNFVSQVGDLSDIAGGSASIPYFRNVQPSKTEKQVADAADKALAAIQKEIDVWTRDRFYVFAGGDFGGNRVLESFLYGSVQVLTDHHALDDYPISAGEFKGDLPEGRLNALYAKHVRLDLTNNSVSNIKLYNEIGVDLRTHRRLHYTIGFEDDVDSFSPVKYTIRVAGQYVNPDGLSNGNVVITKSTKVTQSYVADIPDNADLSALKDFFLFEMKQSENQSRVYDVYLTNIWLEYTNPPSNFQDFRLFDRCFVKSWNTTTPDLHFDVILQNTSFTYDQTLAIYALLGAGDIERALILLRSLNYVIGNDTEYSDNRVRNAYRCGPADQIPGDQYDVRMPGWWGRRAHTTQEAKDAGEDKEAAGNLDEYGQDPYAISTWTGTAAWVMMCLGSCYRFLVTHPDYENTDIVKDTLDKWIALSEWVVDSFRADTDYFKGFMGGYYGFSGVDYGAGDTPAPRVPKGVYKTELGQYEGPGQFILPWRSTEHAADLYAAFKHLYEVTGDPKWGDNMRHALEYIDKLWFDGEFDQTANDGPRFDTMSLYLTGTGEVDQDLWSATPNESNLPTDPSVWVTYGTDRLDATRMRSLDWMHRNCRQVGGDPNSLWKYSYYSKAGWIEGAGQSAILFKAYGLPSWWLAALGACVDHQLDTGIMYSVTETAGTGFTLPNVGLQDQPWKYFRRGHVGATSWFLIGWYQINPFKFPVDFAGGATLNRITDVKKREREIDDRIDTTDQDLRDLIYEQVAYIKDIFLSNQNALIEHINAQLAFSTTKGADPLIWTLLPEEDIYTNPEYAGIYFQINTGVQDYKVRFIDPQAITPGTGDPTIVTGDVVGGRNDIEPTYLWSWRLQNKFKVQLVKPPVGDPPNPPNPDAIDSDADVLIQYLDNQQTLVWVRTSRRLVMTSHFVKDFNSADSGSETFVGGMNGSWGSVGGISFNKYIVRSRAGNMGDLTNPIIMLKVTEKYSASLDLGNIDTVDSILNQGDVNV